MLLPEKGRNIVMTKQILACSDHEYVSVIGATIYVRSILAGY